MTYCCLALDLLKGSKFEKFLRAEAAVEQQPDEEGERKGMMKELGPENLRLRLACANMLVTSCMVHWNPDNQARARIMEQLLAPLESWQSDANTRLRCVNESIPWLQEQVTSEALRVCQQTCSCLCSRQTLRHVGLTSGVSSGPWPTELADLRVARDEELSGAMGRLALALCFNFLSRELWRLRGWPAGLVKLLLGGSHDGASAAGAIEKPSARFARHRPWEGG
jgi:hypothetical protein